MTGWHAENFRRAGSGLKDLGEYLKPPPSPAQLRDRGAADLRQMIGRMKRRQAAKAASGE